MKIIRAFVTIFCFSFSVCFFHIFCVTATARRRRAMNEGHVRWCCPLESSPGRRKRREIYISNALPPARISSNEFMWLLLLLQARRTSRVYTTAIKCEKKADYIEGVLRNNYTSRFLNATVIKQYFRLIAIFIFFFIQYIGCLLQSNRIHRDCASFLFQSYICISVSIICMRKTDCTHCID